MIRNLYLRILLVYYKLRYLLNKAKIKKMPDAIAFKYVTIKLALDGSGMVADLEKEIMEEEDEILDFENY